MSDELFRQAVELHKRGCLPEAQALYVRLLDVQPEHVRSLVFLGVLAMQANDPTRALELSARALAVDSRDAAAHLLAGRAQLQLGRKEAALASYDHATALRPDDPQAHYDRAVLLKDLGRPDSALDAFDRAIALRPAFSVALSDRGNLLAQLGRFEAALSSYDAAIAADPDFLDAYCNRGLLLSGALRLQDALASFDQALAIDPHCAHARFSRSLVALLNGDFETGWRDFEARWTSEHCVTSREQRSFAAPLWLGRESAAGKTVLVHCEQGLGDTLQFCRYATALSDLGAQVIFEAPKELAPLLTTLAGVDRVVQRGERLPPFDYHCPVMSLPLAFGTTFATIPHSVPYFSADPAKVRDWRAKLGTRAKLRIGLVWAAGFWPGHPAIQDRRNLPLAMLRGLTHSGVEFYSLQKGERAVGELRQLAGAGWGGPKIVDHTAALHDFSDTAALIECLDAVISVDTSVAHLAGALAKPVWIALRFDACWRWLLARADSPWYPTARLYRQDRAGDWSGVVEAIRTDLARLLAQSGLTEESP